MTLTQTQLNTLEAQAALLRYRLAYIQTQLDALNVRRLRCKKNLDDITSLIEAAEIASNTAEQ